MACVNDSAYLPSSLVTAFNGIPHRDINLNDVPAQFQNSIDYYEAIIIWACVPILVVICLFILMSVYFICVCCCCCCQQHNERSKASKATCGIVVTLFVVLGLACCGVALWAEFTLDTNLSRATDAASGANEIVQDVQTTVKMLNYTQVRREVADLVEAVNSSNASGVEEAVRAAGSLSAQIPTLETSFMQIQSDANFQDFSSVLDTVDTVELARHWAVVAYVIVTVLVLVVMAVSVCCGALCGSPICMVIAVVFVALYAVTMWVAVGGNLAYLIITGDICGAPDELIRMQFSGSNGSTDLPQATVDYYLVCGNMSCFSNPFMEYQAEADRAIGTIMADQALLVQYADDNSLTDVRRTLSAVADTVSDLSSTLANVTLLTDCEGINEQYLGLLSGLCEDGYLYSLILFAMACGLALIFILLLCFGSLYAGMLSKGRKFDDETIVYDFPTEEGPSPWQSYGTQQQRYHKTQTPNSFSETFNMGGNPQAEPPRYTDLQQDSPVDAMPSNGVRTSGTYDNLVS